MDACQGTISNAGEGKVLDVVKGVLSSCHFHAVNPESVLWSKVSSAGRSRGFNASVEAQKNLEERERQNRDDEVSVVKRYHRFDQVVPTRLTSAGSVLANMV